MVLRKDFTGLQFSFSGAFNVKLFNSSSPLFIACFSYGFRDWSSSDWQPGWDFSYVYGKIHLCFVQFTFLQGHIVLYQYNKKPIPPAAHRSRRSLTQSQEKRLFHSIEETIEENLVALQDPVNLMVRTVNRTYTFVDLFNAPLIRGKKCVMMKPWNIELAGVLLKLI